MRENGSNKNNVFSRPLALAIKILKWLQTVPNKLLCALTNFRLQVLAWLDSQLGLGLPESCWANSCESVSFPGIGVSLFHYSIGRKKYIYIYSVQGRKWNFPTILPKKSSNCFSTVIRGVNFILTWTMCWTMDSDWVFIWFVWRTDGDKDKKV